ncbi:hypothetical protein Tco_0771903 [Tanacetum coccineum]|uniref:Retrovirus-related Pol polyprotein from transposon TNT 1-94-like beta-barrel domain-containing protein n=1 Tax=Tanacetum coccineum TaxID=301880 RepID=A0ABQ4ZHH8_9ASTR
MEVIKPTYDDDDDQIDSNIIFDDQDVVDNSEKDTQDNNAHDQTTTEFELLVRNVHLEAEKTNKMYKLICVTPFNKQSFQKDKFVSKTVEKYVLTKPITSQTLPKKKKENFKNANVISLGMYKVKTKDMQETHVQANKNVSPSTGVKLKKSVLFNTKSRCTSEFGKKVETYVQTNNKLHVTPTLAMSKEKTNVINVNSQSASKAKSNVICVSCSFHMLTLCHDKCVAKQALSVHSRANRALFTFPIAAETSGCSKHMTGNLKLLRNFVEKFMRTVCFRDDHFDAITGYGDFVHGNVTICYVYYIEGLGHNLFFVRQFCDGDLEVA